MRTATIVLISLLFTAAFAGPTRAATSDGQPSKGLQEPPYLADEVLVTYHEGVPARAARDALAVRVGIEEVSFAPVTRLFRYKIRDGSSVDDKQALLSKQPEVERVNKNWLGEAFFTPNDTHYSQQWGMPKVKMPAAWDTLVAAGKPGGSSKYLTVVDSGVDLNHPDLGYIWGWNFVDGNNQRGDECYGSQGHGSMVAGVAAAYTNNSLGIAGANYAAKIMSAKALYWDSQTQRCRVLYSAAVNAIEYAVNNGASVITAS